jgi:hypothetical protein
MQAAAVVVMLSSTACAPLPTYEPRAARSSLGCMHAALDKLELKHQPDSEQHCKAAGLIARYCSVTEAGMASIGKEVRDLFTGGDAEWRDLVSDRRGVRCARLAHNDTDLAACCAPATPP